MTIGEFLAENRRKQGKSIRDVEKATKIAGKYIEAIENNQFDAIPGNVYAKGFIRNYADFLGVEFEPLLRQFRLEFEEKKTPETVKGYTFVDISQRPNVGQRIIVGAVIRFFLILLVIWLWGFSLGGPGRGSENSTTTTTGRPLATSDRPTSTIPTEVTLKFTAVADKGCWLRVLVDGKKAYEDVLKKGQEMT